MQNQSRILLRVLILVVLPVFAAQYAAAQIVNAIEADIPHSFTIANTTLPPGKYTFRMAQGSDLTVMSCQNVEGNMTIEFLVESARDNHTPRHSELIFDRYGNREFLKKVFEGGNPSGVNVIEPSRDEKRFQKQGQKPVEHTEEQAK